MSAGTSVIANIFAQKNPSRLTGKFLFVTDMFREFVEADTFQKIFQAFAFACVRREKIYRRVDNLVKRHFVAHGQKLSTAEKNFEFARADNADVVRVDLHAVVRTARHADRELRGKNFVRVSTFNFAGKKSPPIVDDDIFIRNGYVS